MCHPCTRSVNPLAQTDFPLEKGRPGDTSRFSACFSEPRPVLRRVERVARGDVAAQLAVEGDQRRLLGDAELALLCLLPVEVELEDDQLLVGRILGGARDQRLLPGADRSPRRVDIDQDRTALLLRGGKGRIGIRLELRSLCRLHEGDRGERAEGKGERAGGEHGLSREAGKRP